MGTSMYTKSPRNSMKAGRRSAGSLPSASVIFSIPGTFNGCERMLYGKFGFMQLDVTKDSLFAAGDPGCGAVIKLPVLLLDSEYL